MLERPSEPVCKLIRDCPLILDLSGTTRSAVLAELVDALGEALSSTRPFLAEVEAREAVQTTDSGRGSAFPHARSSLASRLVLAIGRSTEGVSFREGSQPVRLVFLFGIPSEGIAHYLEAVAWLVKITRLPERYQHLLLAESPERLRELLCPLE
jgi:mannitol/fructose-specific phosphotransferase system IIA component (Ntr-type)